MIHSFPRPAVPVRALLGAWVTAAGLAGTPGAETFSTPQVEFFETRIRPVLVAHCHSCHSAEAPKLRAGLRLDSRAGLLQGGESGPAVVPGDPARSLLFRAVQYHNPDTAMPPKAKLDDRVIADIERWVKDGVAWPAGAAMALETRTEWNWAELKAKHWAFQPMQHPVPPPVRDTAWPQSPVDQFILAGLEAAGLAPAPPADRRTLIRRVSLDLTGLPPSPAEIEDFLADTSPGAFARVVDRLLASPRYGERWARHWLDVARYSDGLGGFLDGTEKRNEAWRYRDWVVRALNRDLPFDRFVTCQIAGDALADGGDALVGTGFLALGPNYQSDGGTEEGNAVARAETLDDRVDTVTRGLLALTVSCARCHDHKFDPIPTEDYYSLAGVFQNTRNEDRMDPATPRSVVEAYDRGQKAIRDCDQRLGAVREGAKKAKRELTPDEKTLVSALEKELAELRRVAPPRYGMVHAVADTGTNDMRVALRGNLLKPGSVVPRRFLRIVGGASPRLFQRGSGRLDLAEALVDPENPLTARVFVNRVWMHHFGRALVRTPDNFGIAGEKPTHPALLDWLARRFIAQGWSIKQLHRTILLSAAYQMSSRTEARSFAVDGDNRLIWRMEPRRLDVEAWRDALLAVTGGLDPAMGGPSTDSLLGSPRRTLYSLISRNGDRLESDDFLRLFDLPSARATSAGRGTSIVPQQYLFMMNNPFMARRAGALFPRNGGGTVRDRIGAAYLVLYGRPATGPELRAGEEFLAGAGGAGDAVPDGAWAQYAQVLLSSNEFLFVR